MLSLRRSGKTGNRIQVLSTNRKPEVYYVSFKAFTLQMSKSYTNLPLAFKSLSSLYFFKRLHSMSHNFRPNTISPMFVVRSLDLGHWDSFAIQGHTISTTA